MNRKQCPIANLLRLDGVIPNTVLASYSGYEPDLFKKHSKIVSNFIVHFDHGQYPELEA
jgi:hypothetical protein